MTMSRIEASERENDVFNDLIGEFSKLSANFCDKHKNEFETNTMVEMVLIASMSFTVATAIAMGLNEVDLHEGLNAKWSDLSKMDEFKELLNGK
jgi:hypothetical protein